MEPAIPERWQWLGSIDGQIDGKKAAMHAKNLAIKSNKSWGRAADRRGWSSGLFSLFMMVMPPILMTLSWIALEYFDGSLLQTVGALAKLGAAEFLESYAPSLTAKSVKIYGLWTAYQWFLYAVLPGRGKGQLTPAGELLEYNVNGMRAWTISVGLAIVGYFTGLINPAILTDNWAGLLVTANLWGWILSLVAFAKAYVAPTHPADRKFSGSMLYDFYMGIELNPRFSKASNLDWKLFHNTRPGMIGWTLVDLAYTAEQYQRFGYVTYSMMVVNILHAAYVIDLFWYEDWYLRTIDICHDHFGFYFAWGSAAWLPTMYTLQAQYLARRPVELHPVVALGILMSGLSGYLIFRDVNNQKNVVRKQNGDAKIWGKPAEVIRARYLTVDGLERESLLLCSGWWGWARHANYIGDLLLSYSMCAPCGLTHILPWTYAIFMTMILLHRCHRDEKRCMDKYGKIYADYCKRVPYRLLPGVY